MNCFKGDVVKLQKDIEYAALYYQGISRISDNVVEVLVKSKDLEPLKKFLMSKYKKNFTSADKAGEDSVISLTFK